MAAPAKMVKPAQQGLVHLTVLRRERISPHFIRVTLGGAEVSRFVPMGYDQWFRLFLPVGGAEGLDRIPAKANKTLGYLKFLRIPEGVRPVMRNYTVRAYRPKTALVDAEIDVDFVLHGSAAEGTAGPASAWAETCEVGESVVIIDEGLTFNPERGTDRVVLVGDETGLPAISSICASLPAHATGLAIVEVPSRDDALPFDHPAGVGVTFLVRDEAGVPDKPGVLALDALREATLPTGPFHAYLCGEQALATGGRRYLVGERAVDKNSVSFCGYWRDAPEKAPAPEGAHA